MKKLFTTAMLAIAMLFTANNAHAGINFGVKGGVNVTSMSLDSKVFDSSNRAGFFIGPTVKFTLPIVGLGIDASALYDQREAKLKVEDEDANVNVVDSKLKQQSIMVPINLRYGFGLGSAASIYLFAGPQFGFNVGDKNQSIVKDVADWKLKTSNFSINVGLGAMLLKHLQVSANYNIACGKTGEVTTSGVIGTTVQEAVGKTTGRSNAWQIGVAYYF